MKPYIKRLITILVYSLLVAQVSSLGGGQQISVFDSINTNNSSAHIMGSKGYVGTPLHELEERGIHLSGSKSCKNSTENIQSVSLSVITTNISRIALSVVNTNGDATLMRSTWRADQDHVCWASFSLDANLLLKARLFFDFDRNVSALHSSDGCFFDLQNYTNWDSVVVIDIVE